MNDGDFIFVTRESPLYYPGLGPVDMNLEGVFPALLIVFLNPDCDNRVITVV